MVFSTRGRCNDDAIKYFSPDKKKWLYRRADHKPQNTVGWACYNDDAPNNTVWAGHEKLLLVNKQLSSIIWNAHYCPELCNSFCKNIYNSKYYFISLNIACYTRVLNYK